MWKKSDIPTYPDPQERSTYLNLDITFEECDQALQKAKSGKAIGIDGLPEEVLRNTNCVQFMFYLFKVCFNSGFIPTVWGKGIIAPG